MNIQDHLKLAYRNKYLIIITTLACVLSGYFFYINQSSNHYETNQLISFAIQNQKPSVSDSSPYENLEAADQITESIQGWFISPAFLNELQQQTTLNYSIKARKQEKNNLLITFNSENQLNAQKYSEQILKSLQNRLDQYNQKSDLRINAAITESQTNTKNSNPILYLSLGFLIGLIVSYLASLSWEKLGNFTNTAEEVEAILKIPILDQYFNESSLVKNHLYLTKLISQKLKGDELQIIDLTKRSRFGLEIISKYTNYQSMKSYNLPADLEKIKFAKPSLIIVQLGHTTKNCLQRLAKIDLSHCEVIIIDHL